MEGMMLWKGKYTAK